MNYQFAIHANTEIELKQYQRALVTKPSLAGHFFKQALADLSSNELKELPLDDFTERLLNTKRPQIFAEMSIAGDGTDWTIEELRLLGAIACAVPCTLFDDGLHHSSNPHSTPLEGHLLFVPGPLLRHRSGQHHRACDYDLVTTNGELDQSKYTQLITKRLLPSLKWAQKRCQKLGKKALITIPGIGCGVFAGPFRGQLERYLENALASILSKYGEQLGQIQALYFDPYNVLQDRTQKIASSYLITKPLLSNGQPQLCYPQSYNQGDLDFSNCALFSVVAWDHVSWPGNDYYIGSRATDDGVKGAASDVIYRLSGVKGEYNIQREMYLPPKPYRHWQELVIEQSCQLRYSKFVCGQAEDK